jgi:hypothetical protein
MIRKSEQRFSEKIMSEQQAEAADRNPSLTTTAIG